MPGRIPCFKTGLARFETGDLQLALFQQPLNAELVPEHTTRRIRLDRCRNGRNARAHRRRHNAVVEPLQIEDAFSRTSHHQYTIIGVHLWKLLTGDRRIGLTQAESPRLPTLRDARRKQQVACRSETRPALTVRSTW